MAQFGISRTHGDEAGQEPLFQLFIAKVVDHPRGHVVDGNKGGSGWAAIGHLFHDERGFHPRQTNAAGIF